MATLTINGWTFPITLDGDQKLAIIPADEIRKITPHIHEVQGKHFTDIVSSIYVSGENLVFALTTDGLTSDETLTMIKLLVGQAVTLFNERNPEDTPGQSEPTASARAGTGRQATKSFTQRPKRLRHGRR